MRPSIKILSLPNWVKFHDEFYELGDDPLLGGKRYPEIKPRFNRDGMYFDRRSNECWIEIGGKAYVGDLPMFKYDLELEDYELLTDRELAALRTLHHVTRDVTLKRLIYMRLAKHKQKSDLRDIRWSR